MLLSKNLSAMRLLFATSKLARFSISSGVSISWMYWSFRLYWHFWTSLSCCHIRSSALSMTPSVIFKCLLKSTGELRPSVRSRTSRSARTSIRCQRQSSRRSVSLRSVQQRSISVTILTPSKLMQSCRLLTKSLKVNAHSNQSIFYQSWPLLFLQENWTTNSPWSSGKLVQALKAIWTPTKLSLTVLWRSSASHSLMLFTLMTTSTCLSPPTTPSPLSCISPLLSNATRLCFQVSALYSPLSNKSRKSSRTS